MIVTIGVMPPGNLWSENNSENAILLQGRVKYNIGRHLEVLVDEEKQLDIQNITASPFNNQFKRVDAQVPNLGITDAAVWARFTIFNPFEAPRQKLLSFNFPMADHVSFFIPQGPGEFKKLDAGHSVPAPDELVPNRYYVFPLTVPAQKKMTFYVRVVSNANMVLPMTIWEPSALDRKDHSDQMLYGIIYGILVAFIVYFAAVAIRLQNISAMWFTFYIISLGLLMGCYQGYIQELLRPLFADLNRVLLITVIGSLYFTGAKFLRTFLHINFYSKRVDKILWGLQWMGIGFIPMNIFANPLTPLYSIILVGIGPIFSTTVSIVFWIRGVPNAKYFAIGWIIGHITSEIDLLRIFGVIPWMPGNMNLLPAAMVSSIIFFSIAIMEQTREYRDDAQQDNLTGIGNRRRFDQAFAIEWNRNLRSQQPLSVIMADIDDFKAFNDTYGHIQGDECLKAVARVFDKNLQRAGDLAARYGGEEFIGLLPDTLSSEAAFLAEKIREAVERLGIRHSESRTGKIVSISLGTGTMVPNTEKTPADVIQQADEALYLAKNTGRNRVVSL